MILQLLDTQPNQFELCKHVVNSTQCVQLSSLSFSISLSLCRNNSVAYFDRNILLSYILSGTFYVLVTAAER